MKINRLVRHLWLFALILGVVGCQTEDEPTDLDSGREYLPLQVGWYQVYAVSEIKYQLGLPEALDYELKVQVTDSFPAGSGGYNYVLNRSTREVGESSWNYLDTWSARVDTQGAVVSEGNIPFLKIRLPLTEGTSWNGNAYNIGDIDEYVLTDLHVPFEAGGVSYDDCAVVLQADSDDYIVFLDQRKEVYARSVGLIYKEVTQLHFCTLVDCVGMQEIDEGVVLKQTIVAYGVE